MVTKELLVYIRKQMAKDTSPAELRLKLKNAGWKNEDVEQAFNNIYSKYFMTVSDTFESVKEQYTRKKVSASKMLIYYFVFGSLFFLVTSVFYIRYARENFITNPQDAFYVASKNITETASLSYQIRVNATFTDKSIGKDDLESVGSFTHALVDLANNTQSYFLEMTGQIDKATKMISSDIDLKLSSPLVTSSKLKGQAVIVQDKIYYRFDWPEATGVFFDENESNNWLINNDLDNSNPFQIEDQSQNIEVKVKRIRKEVLDGKNVNYFVFDTTMRDVADLIRQFPLARNLVGEIFGEIYQTDSYSIRNGKAWIGEDGFLYMISFDIVSDPVKNSDLISEIQVEIGLSDYGVPVQIPVPQILLPENDSN
ncbi:hypothetical protein IPM62_05035 [Candidatus Woesebacteria bacterium]|nr:MAG: hypothetical protein IPM62_05035 [Candidatus Woesebacteria bacterium]